MKRITRWLAFVTITGAVGCERTAPDGVPADQAEARWADAGAEIGIVALRTDRELRRAIPECRPRARLITSDSIGPVRAGQSLAELVAACPEARFGWDRTLPGMPAPAAAVAVGDAIVVAHLSDTTNAAIVRFVLTADLSTPEGIGAGSMLDELLEAYGPGELIDVECALEITFPAAPRLTFGLDPGGEPLPCEEAARLAAEDALERLPPGTFVTYVIQR